MHQRHIAPQFQREAAARLWDDPQVGAFLLEPPAEQQQPALEVVLPLGQVERLVQAKLAIGELRATLRLPRVQQLPQDSCRQAANQVFAVDENAFVGVVVGDLAPGR